MSQNIQLLEGNLDLATFWVFITPSYFDYFGVFCMHFTAFRLPIFMRTQCSINVIHVLRFKVDQMENRFHPQKPTKALITVRMCLPWQTKEAGDSPGWTLAVRKTIFCFWLRLVFSGFVIVSKSTRLCCCRESIGRYSWVSYIFLFCMDLYFSSEDIQSTALLDKSQSFFKEIVWSLKKQVSQFIEVKWNYITSDHNPKMYWYSKCLAGSKFETRQFFNTKKL